MSINFIFSFRPRFVNPIRLGLGLQEFDEPRFPPAMGLPKLQTIRAERKDKKRPKPGDTALMFSGMRTKQCRLIVPRGAARIDAVSPIFLRFNGGKLRDVGLQEMTMFDERFTDFDDFARKDGFASSDEMAKFWWQEHPGVEEFHGFITFWKPS